MASSDVTTTGGLNRRSLVKLSLAGSLGAGLVASGGLNGRENGANHYDAIIIGGGFAGVTAGRELSLRGVRTLLLEARTRIGGRTFTAPFAGHNVDMGGTWFGPGQPYIWSEMTRHGVGLKESAAASAEEAIWYDNARRVSGSIAQWAALHEAGTNQFFAPARGAFPRAHDPLFQADTAGYDQQTAQEVIDGLTLSAAERGLLECFAAINGHSVASKSSYLDQLHWAALGGFDIWNLWDSLSRYRADGGTQALLGKIQQESGAELKLGAVVQKVQQNAAGVTVTMRSGEQFTAAQVIVAVPMNCLNDIEFEPELSAVKRAASERRHTGSGTKVYARINSRRPVFLGTGQQEFPLCFGWTEYDDDDHQVLCGFGAAPAFLDINDDEAVTAAFKRFAPDIEVTDVFGYDWNLDPFAKGTWCMYPPGMLTTSLAELQRSEGAIHFAGSDIANGWRGFIDGAIETGISSAKQVIDYFDKRRGIPA